MRHLIVVSSAIRQSACYYRPPTDATASRPASDWHRRRPRWRDPRAPARCRVRCYWDPRGHARPHLGQMDASPSAAHRELDARFHAHRLDGPHTAFNEGHGRRITSSRIPRRRHLPRTACRRARPASPFKTAHDGQRLAQRIYFEGTSSAPEEMFIPPRRTTTSSST
jgi:hypothetical protein